jgi:hypothetical protein
MQNAAVYAEITKSTVEADGTLSVYGKVSDETLDIDQQIVDRGWLDAALPEWFKWGNIREQHDGGRAVGVATDLHPLDDGHYIKANVIDPVSRAKVEAGVLKGFSIGIRRPQLVHDKSASGGRIVGGEIVEVSLVDRPANPSCTLTIAKSAVAGMDVESEDFDEERQLVRVEELVETETKNAMTRDNTQPEDNAGDPSLDGDTDEGSPNAKKPKNMDDEDEEDTMTDGEPERKMSSPFQKSVNGETSGVTPELVKTVLESPQIREHIEEAIKSATQAAAESFEERLSRIEEMAAPGGPARTRTAGDSMKDARDEKLREAAYYKAAAASTDDPMLRDGYMKLAARAETHIP